MIRRLVLLAICAAVLALLVPSVATAAECKLDPRAQCFGVESADVSLSTAEAGAHPDLKLDVAIKQDPLTEKNVFGLRDAFSPTRDIQFNLPPGLIGNPNVLGAPQQCTVAELVGEKLCPNGSQVGITIVGVHQTNVEGLLHEPVYMMTPPGGEVIARLGLIAGAFPTFIDFTVRSEGDYGLSAEVTEASPIARLITLESTIWGVPADSSHDEERCTPGEALFGCVASPKRPPGSRPLPFLTNPTRCDASLELGVNASSWFDSVLHPEKEVFAPFPAIEGCDSLPFGPALAVQPTSHHTSSPTGLDMTIDLPASDGVNVLEPAQVKDIRIDLPTGIAINPGNADGLTTCSAAQVHFGERVSAACPDGSKMASTEFEIGALPRRMKGAIYLREPEPENLFRVWIVADDLGAHVKLPGQLEVDKETGQIDSVVLDNPQVPLREVKLLFKSGFRAPLMTPSACGPYLTHYEFTTWSGGPPAIGDVPMGIDEGCVSGGFRPRLVAGSTDAQAGAFSPFAFTISRHDSEEDLADLALTLPTGIAASFVGIPHCEGADAQSGHCPAASRIGRTVVADGAGPDPLWVPQPGKDPTAIYLGGPYRGAPLSIIAVVPAQAGPFDLGLQVVRSAVFLDPETAQATAKADSLPQIIEGIPVTYKTLDVQLDRPHFTLNPTSCARKETVASLHSVGGKLASSTASYAASDCAKLGFEPKLSLRLFGATHRGAHPRLRAVLKMPSGGANIGETQVALPVSEFVDNEHFDNICTRVDFAADRCPAGSIYGHAVARTPLFDFPLEGPVYLRSAPGRELPDLVAALSGPPSMPIEIDVDGHVDSINGRLRTTFESIPDAPVTSFTLEMQGGKKGLLQNAASPNLCAAPHFAIAKFTGQNGRIANLRPRVQAVSCKGRTKKRR